MLKHIFSQVQGTLFSFSPTHTHKHTHIFSMLYDYSVSDSLSWCIFRPPQVCVCVCVGGRWLGGCGCLFPCECVSLCEHVFLYLWLHYHFVGSVRVISI